MRTNFIPLHSLLIPDEVHLNHPLKQSLKACKVKNMQSEQPNDYGGTEVIILLLDTDMIACLLLWLLSYSVFSVCLSFSSSSYK